MKQRHFSIIRLSTFLGILISAINGAASVFADAGGGWSGSPSWCGGGESCVVKTWVRLNEKGINVGGSNCSTGEYVYFLAKIWSGGYEVVDVSDRTVWADIDGFMYHGHPINMSGIAKDTASDWVSAATFDGHSGSAVSYSDALSAWEKVTDRKGFTWADSSGNATGTVAWFCQDPNPDTSTPTPTPTTSPPSTEEKIEWEDHETHYEGQPKVDYTTKGSETKSGDTVTIWNQWDPVSVDPKFEHCLRVTSGAPPSGSGLDASTEWSISGDSASGGGTWGHSNYPSSCTRVSSPTTATKSTTLGNNVKVCQTLKYYATVKWQRGRTYTEDADGNKTYTSDWIYYRFIGRTDPQNKEACMTFYHPYMYIDYEDTYTGKVTGTTEAVVRECENLTAADGEEKKKECFIKSSVTEGTTGTDADAAAKTNVKFQDDLSRSSNIIQDKHNDESRRNTNFSLNNDPGAEWRTEGITGATGESLGGIVRTFNENTKLVGALGYSDLDQHNHFSWTKTVKWVLRSDGKRGMVVRSDLGANNAWAKVGFDFYHPYNYNTDVSAKFENTDLYVGQTATAEVGARYLARPNHPVTGDESSGYQTALPSNIGRYYAVFTLPADANQSSINSIVSETTSIARTPSNAHDLCATLNGHIDNFLTEKCQSNEIVSSKININIPDEIGVKICVVSGVNYADSHGLPGATIQLADNKNNDAVPNASRSELMINSDYWKISGVSCETIKAKPRFQTWNAGFFTEGGVRMSVEQKVPSQIFSVGDASEPKLGFGSWSETSFIQGTTSAGFASSSKLGGKGMSDYSFCNSSAVSIANIEDDTPSDAACSGGNAIIESGIHSATTDTIEKTLLRYIPAKSDITNSCKDGSYCDLAPVGNNVSPGKYTYYTGNTKIDGFTLTLGGTETTRIIVVEGTAIITGNICIGSGGCESGGVLSTATRNTEPISDIKNLVNVIIIADEIRIDASVTQIDATLMALGTISGESSVKSRIMGNQGIINTCGAVNGTSVANDIKDDDNAITACRNTLLINGPLFAGKLIPNRTKYEVGPGALITPTQDLQSMGSSTPAEIFNLSPAVYFWAFEQSSRYTQANTVYTVELAPRL